mmetsp:Transcript_20584/g.45040  ORF Transcript_20584/g.45040 Transcript_20584/m.45040 type:complete len:246 (+) Transcript_20584:697-1434(+)
MASLLLNHSFFLLDHIAEPLSARKHQGAAEFKDHDTWSLFRIGPILDVPPLPPNHLDLAKYNSLRRSSISDHKGNGEHHCNRDALQNAQINREEKSQDPYDEVPSQTPVFCRSPETPEFTRCAEVYEALRGVDDNGGQGRLRQKLQRWSEVHEAEGNDCGAEDASQLSLHAALLCKARAAERTARRESSKEGAGNASGAQADHLLGRIERVPKLDRHLLGRGICREESREGNERTTGNEGLEKAG